MTNLTKRFAPLALVLALTCSCTETKKNTQEETAITTMDSTSNIVQENSAKLDDQTKKVEASLEELDAEFKPAN